MQYLKLHKKSLLSKKISKRHDYFYFGVGFLNKAKIHIKRTRSNIFVTLTDLKDSVVICQSSGMAAPFFSRKKKVSKFALRYIVNNLNRYLLFYKIKQLVVVINIKIKSQFFALINELAARGLIITTLINQFKNAHNGVKIKRRPRK